MKSFTEPQILTDKSRLQEIFDLRVYAWENSPSPANINKETYPNGFFDKLDEMAIHWVSFDENGKIIASARLAIINDVNELPYPQIFANIGLPSQRPFLFYSRLVIHPDYRKIGLKEKFDIVRLRYQVENIVAFSVATASQSRTKELLKYGWKDLCEVNEHMDKAFPFVKERSLLLLLNDVKLPSKGFTESNDNVSDTEDFHVCGFQYGKLLEIEEERSENTLYNADYNN